MDRQLITELFAAADSRDTGQFSKFLTEDVVFRFGNSPTLHGRAAVVESLARFYDYLVDISHEIIGVWNCDDTWIVETRAHYVDIYERSFSFPACNIMICEGDRVSDYRIFVDNSAMFIPPEN